MTLARGRRGPPSSPPTLCAAFSRDLSSWSTGAHSPRPASPTSFCTASLLLAPADPGLLPGWAPSVLLAPPPDPSSPFATGLSSLLEAFLLSSFPPDAFLPPLLLILPHGGPHNRFSFPRSRRIYYITFQKNLGDEVLTPRLSSRLWG